MSYYASQSNYSMYEQIKRKKIDAIQISYPHSERQILELQDLFFKPGLHYVNVASINSGRAIITTFLQTMPLFHQVGYLTHESYDTLHPSVGISLHELLQPQEMNNKFDNYAAIDLEQFFIDQFFFDFIWIEATDQLIQELWFEQFSALLTQLKFDRQLPIFVLIPPVR